MTSPNHLRLLFGNNCAASGYGNAYTDEFDAILNENPDSLVVIDFYATWCGPCKIMGPKFLKLSNEFTSVVFVKVDVDESEDIVSRFDIKVMPTFIFMRKGAQI
ncbi:thioredoxin, partial [Ancylostoma duodenale]